MKKLIPIAAILFLFISLGCKKKIEDKQKDILVEAMTNGIWIVEFYKEDTVDITTDFSGYEFQFFENGTVNANKGGTITSGTWSGDINTATITSNFPTAGNPLLKLNGTWKVTDSYWNYVEAEMNTPTGKNKLHLLKKP